PLDGALEHALVVVIHPEDETAVDHDPEIVEAPGHRRIIASEILALAAAAEVVGRERLEPDEEAAQPGIGRALDQVAAEDRIHGRGALKETVHAGHPVE